MKNFYSSYYSINKLLPFAILLFLIQPFQKVIAQTATVSNPLAIGQNCGGGGSNFKAFTYDSSLKKLTQVGSNCNPSLQSPGFNPGGGSIAFSPKDQKVYYIETTTGNNSIVWGWTPGVCPVSNQAPIYTYSSTFIVGLEFNSVTGDGWQIEFSTGSAPYNVYLRKVTSFGPPLVAGAPQQIIFPAGKNIYQQNGDVVITPTGAMYFVLNNKMFSLDYSTYGTGTLNATYIDTLKNGTGNNVIGLTFVNGNFITSVQGTTCSYNQVDISTGAAVVQPVTLASGTFVSYDMATMLTGIGVAKKINSISKTGSTTYTVSYDVFIKNYGNVNLSSVLVKDSVQKLFGSAFVSATIAAVGTLPSGLTLNPSFNGNTNSDLFASGSTMKASPADSGTVRVTVNLNNPTLSTTYLNSAIATATGTIFSNAVRDSSNNSGGLDPDPSRRGVPDYKGQGVPTPLNLTSWLLLANNLANFNVKHTSSYNDIDWVLDNEEYGGTIEVQRSANGQDFQSITSIKTKTVAHEQFSWRDLHPLDADNYYRLVITPANATQKIYSQIVVIRKIAADAVMTIWPNPFVNSLKVAVKVEKGQTVSYKILDYLSVVVASDEVNCRSGLNEVTISELGKLPGGTYILDITIGDKHYFRKLMKSAK